MCVVSQGVSLMGLNLIYLIKNNSPHRVSKACEERSFSSKKIKSLFQDISLKLIITLCHHKVFAKIYRFPYISLVFPSFSFLYRTSYLSLTYHQLGSLKNNSSNVGWQESSRNSPTIANLLNWTCRSLFVSEYLM